MTRAGRENSASPIALLTDFGYRDHYVGVMKGVIHKIAPGAQIIDITHGIPPQSIAAGAIAIEQSWRHFPQRTIFVAVVDPGVGTSRLPIAVETAAGARFIGPDNGLLWRVVEEAGLRRAVELRSPRYRLSEVSETFHGRDIFAPAAAHLWRGVRLGAMGPPLGALVKPAAVLPGVVERRNEIAGTIVYVDGFGNLITNIDRECFERFASRFRGFRLSVRIARRAPIEIRKAYGEADAGDPLATFGSFERLEIAVRDGSAAEKLAARIGALVTIRAVRRSSDG